MSPGVCGGELRWPPYVGSSLGVPGSPGSLQSLRYATDDSGTALFAAGTGP
jgi:hypothetical protein